MERRVAKLIAFILIFAVMAICGLIPIKVSGWFHKKGEQGRHYLSIVSCFGGGVFFGAYLMHMAPEVRAQLEEALLTPYNIFYPIPELMTAVGFFLLLFVDKIVMLLLKKKKKNGDSVSEKDLEYDNNNLEKECGAELTYCSVKHTHGMDGVHAGHIVPTSPRLQARRVSKSQDIVQIQDQETTENDHVTSSTADLQKVVVSVSESQTQHEHGGSDENLSGRPYIFLVALSIDCIFEGISLGLQTTTWGVWLLLIAILSHETVICFSFGLRILKLFSTRKVVIMIIGYAITIPIGCTIGFVIFETTSAGREIDIVSGIFMAISAGIFIYVSFFEILNEELTHDSNISKVIAAAMGFAFMALLVLLDLIEDGGNLKGDGGANFTVFVTE